MNDSLPGGLETGCSEAELRKVLIDFNDTTTTYPNQSLIHQLFEQQVELTPNAIAVSYLEHDVTYEQLNIKANQLAHFLRDLGVTPDTRVAICVDRGIEMVVGVLAILKAGGAYVPLDPKYPADRLAYMLEDSAPIALLTQESFKNMFAHLKMSVKVIDLFKFIGTQANWPTKNLPASEYGLTCRHLAYIIYTSGSTGEPKGVAIEHRSAVNFICWGQSSFPLIASNTIYFSTSLNFDLSVFELFVPITTGGHVRIVQNALEISQAQNDGILINTVPSAINALLELNQVSDSIRMINLAGEPLKRQLVEKIFAQTNVETVCNLYGPTETTTYSTWVRMDRAQGFVSHIGRPVANTTIYILDDQHRPAAIGESGEIHIGGAGVARGYLNRPELSAERFIKDPFSTQQNARMYKTGDLGKWLPDGNIEYLGRNDFQVKIRGFRIELGEIENQLEACAAVRESYVVAREDHPGNKRLVAYLVTENGDCSIADIRQQLEKQLPAFMLPDAFVVLEKFPLTPNGKIDRAALPAPARSASATQEYSPPLAGRETDIAQIWQELLKLNEISRDDNFFELGGHSLLSVQLSSRLHQKFGVAIALQALFEHPTIASLAELVSKAKVSEWVPIVAFDHQKPLPMSWAQQRLWFLNELDPNAGVAYHIVKTYLLKGTLKFSAIEHAINQLIDRHESLRTTFAQINGAPMQIITQEPHKFTISQQDLSQLSGEDRQLKLNEISLSEINRPFNLQQGPLFRVILFRLSNDEHQLLFIQHHIISDGWSIGILMHELASLYSAFCHGESSPLPALTFQYADYSNWQQQYLKNDILQQQLDFWCEHLADAPVLLNLPTDRPRGERQSYRGNRLDFSLGRDLTTELEHFSRRHGVTLFMTLLTAWTSLLSRLSGQNEVVIGTPLANRQLQEVEGVTGFFVNTLALRVDLKESPSVEQLLAQIKVNMLSAFEYQDIPLDRIIEVLNPPRSLSYNPLFQSMIALDNTPGKDQLLMPDLELSLAHSPQQTSLVDLSLLLEFNDGILEGSLEFASDLFNEETIQRFCDYLKTLLNAMIADSSQAVSELPLISNSEMDGTSHSSLDERHKILVSFNDTAVDYPKDALLHQIFEQQSELTPNAIALEFNGGSISYAELNHQANQLAHRLIELGVKRDNLVAIGLERSAANIIGWLAVLKAGAAYLPLEPGYPSERINYLLNDAKPAVILTESALAEKWSITDIPLLMLDKDAEQIATKSKQNPLVAQLTANNLAYVIYTSGSTGEPKGVMVEHRNVLRLVMNSNYAPITPEDCIGHCANPAFDASTWEVWAALLNGARLLILSSDDVLDPQRLNNELVAHKVTAMWLTVGLFNEYVDHLEQAFSQLTWLLVGGDVLDPKTIAQALGKAKPPRHLLNGYGPTETTTFATTFEITDPDNLTGTIPIGRPISNTQIYILDQHLQPVPVGVAGEIYIAGDGVARGYLNRPELTNERFINDPFSTFETSKMYKSGDIGRWLADGNIEYIGRNDFQVKIRGFRIETGEIESRIAEFPGILKALVVAQTTTQNEKRLVAYLIVKDAEQFQLANLRQQLKNSLPLFMLPADFVLLEKFPLTSNGKVDRKALPQPDEQVVQDELRDSQPLTPQQEILAKIWRELLQRQHLSAEDNFFELGGHSLMATRLSAHIREAFGIEFPLRTIFEVPSLSQMSERITSESNNIQSDVLEKLLNDIDSLDDEQARQRLNEMNLSTQDALCNGVEND